MNLLTKQEIETLVKSALSVPWDVDGPVWSRVVWAGPNHRICFMAHSDGLNDDRDMATSRLVAAAPDLARTCLDLMARLEDAQVAQALVVERAAEVMDQKWFIEDSMRDAIKAEIRALAPASGVAALAALRAEIEELNAECERHCDAAQQADGLRYNAEAERDDALARLADAEAQVGALTSLLERAVVRVPPAFHSLRAEIRAAFASAAGGAK